MKRISEKLYLDLGFWFDYENQILSLETKDQKIEIVETKSMGKVLLIDDIIQTTELDEFIYNETLVHTSISCLQFPRNILLIGIGTGGSLREICKRDVETIHAVDINPDTFKIIDIYDNSYYTKDSRVRIFINSAIEQLKEFKKNGLTFDVVIVDAPDPVGSGEELFSSEFYSLIYDVMNDAGCMVQQIGMASLKNDVTLNHYNNIHQIFNHSSIFVQNVPTYFGGLMVFAISSKDDIVYEKPKRFHTGNFYNFEIHESSFKLPQFIKELWSKYNGRHSNYC